MPSSRPAATAKRARPERPQVKGKKARTDDPLRSFSYDGKSRPPPAAAARDENEIDVEGEAGAHEVRTRVVAILRCAVVSLIVPVCC